MRPVAPPESLPLHIKASLKKAVGIAKKPRRERKILFISALMLTCKASCVLLNEVSYIFWSDRGQECQRKKAWKWNKNLEVSSPVPLYVFTSPTPWCTPPWTLIQLLFSMHSPCIVKLPPVIGSYKSGEHSGVGASHGGVDPFGEKGLGGVTFFRWRPYLTWPVIMLAARWRHELILPIFQVLAFKRPKGNKWRERQPDQWVYID